MYFCLVSKLPASFAHAYPSGHFTASSLDCLLFPSGSCALLVVMSGYQFSPFEIGQIKAHMHHGLGAAQMARILVKADGKTH